MQFIIKNPVRQARISGGYTRNIMAQLLGISYIQLHGMETGYVKKINPRWRKPFEQLGINFEALDSEYKRWRENVRERSAAQKQEDKENGTISLAQK